MLYLELEDDVPRTLTMEPSRQAGLVIGLAPATKKREVQTTEIWK